jgi:hypothetical protein
MTTRTFGAEALVALALILAIFMLAMSFGMKLNTHHAIRSDTMQPIVYATFRDC